MPRCFTLLTPYSSIYFVYMDKALVGVVNCKQFNNIEPMLSLECLSPLNLIGVLQVIADSLIKLWLLRFDNTRSQYIDGNYWVITLIFKKYCNLSICLKNCALFSLPTIFTNNLYTYTLIYIIYPVEPSGNIISNYHGAFIHISIHGYDHNFKIYKLNRFISVNVAVLFINVYYFLPMLLLKIFRFLLVELFS